MTGLLLVEFTAEGSNRRTVGVSASYSGAALSLDCLFPYVSRKSIALRTFISDVFRLGNNGALLLPQRLSQKTLTFRLRATLKCTTSRYIQHPWCDRLRVSDHGYLRVRATEDKDTVEHRAYKIAV